MKSIYQVWKKKIKKINTPIREKGPERNALSHLAQEANELRQAIGDFKDFPHYGNLAHIIDEAGDVMFTLAKLLDTYGLTFDDVLHHNHNKLNCEYAARNAVLNTLTDVIAHTCEKKESVS